MSNRSQLSQLMRKPVSVLLVLVLLFSCMAALLSACTKNEAGSTDGTVTYGFLEEELGEETYAIGFRQGDEELAKTVSGAVQALVLDGTYDKIGDKYPEIKDFLCLTAEDVNQDEIPAKGSGDPNYTFKHGFDLDYPPYSYRQDNGAIGGFDVDMAIAVCDYMGWQYEAVPFNWDAKDMELNAGSCDCIWSGFTKEGREDKYTWGITYSNNTQGILVASNSGIGTLSDLAGKRVGVQIDTSAAEMLEDSRKDLADTFGELKTYETYQVAYNDLKAGAIDAIAIDLTAGNYLIADDTKAAETTEQLTDSNYVFLDEELGVETYAIGFRPGDDQLAKTVSGAVQALVQDGTYAKLGEKYPDIKDFLCLTAEDVNPDEIPAKGSGDPNYTFKHGFDLDYPPYSYRNDDGEIGGFDVEMAQAVCEYLGWQYEAVPFNWDAKDMELNAGSCDCIWSGFTKEGREDKYTWGITYSNNTQGILVAKDSGITTLADLAGKKVGVQIDTSAAEMLDDSRKDLADTFGELKTYETYQVAFNDLKAGAIDAIAIDLTAGAYLVSGENEKAAASDSGDTSSSKMSWSTMLSTLGTGMLRTCAIFFLTILFSMPLGILVMFMRRSRVKVVQWIAKIYIAIMRGTPLMLQLLAWYFGPFYLFGWSIQGYRFPAIIIGFTMNYAAYFAEIYRGGFESIPNGQYEAADVLGYNRVQTFFKIILPQVMKNILPSVTNEVITLVKDTSLAFALAYNEMFALAKQIAASQTSFTPYIVAGLFYFIANYVVAYVMEQVEKRFDYYS